MLRIVRILVDVQPKQTMKTRSTFLTRVACVLCTVLLLGACSPRFDSSGSQTATPSPAATLALRVPPGSTMAYRSIDYLLAAHVGETYFKMHYRYVKQEVVAANLIKAIYQFSYPPDVQEQEFVVFFNQSTGQLAADQVSVILLQPQSFTLDATEAAQRATESGLVAGQTLVTQIQFDPVTQRFVWVVTDTTVPHTSTNQGRIYRAVLDVETGQLVATQSIQPSNSQ